MRLAALGLVAVLGLAACGQPSTPSPVTPPVSTPPVQTGPSIPTGSSKITGIVTERTPSGERPVSGANVNAWVQTGTFGYSYMWANGPRLSDAQGRYELAGLPGGADLQVQVYKDGYVQQCAAPPLVVGGEMQLDLQLVARAHVSASRASVPPSPFGLRFVTGVVYELTNDGRRPAPDAFVDYEPIEDSPAALTRTDAAGRFLLCGIPEARTVTISTALGPSRVAYVRVPPGPDADVEIEIK
jgi:hypothetical protein